MKYLFTEAVPQNIDGETSWVSSEKRYQPADTKNDMQYGFLTEKNADENQRLSIPELNSGFGTVYWYRGSNITNIQADAHGCYICSDHGRREVELTQEEEEKIPLTFVTDVSQEGNYQVTVTVYASENIPEGFIFLGRRRLAYIGAFKEQETVTRTFLTNICPFIPRNHEEVMEDLTLDLTIVGAGLHLKEVEIVPATCKTIYIAGDSTVTDQSADYPYYPFHSYCGWGQMLSFFTDYYASGTGYAVSNHSHSGLTTDSFRSEGHYQILYDRIQNGDICLIQFGHNDQKLKSLMADGGYRDNMIRYVQEIRSKGALPVIVTPLARNTWRGNDGTYNDLLEEYANVCKELGEQLEIPVADLHQKSRELVTDLGRQKVKAYYFPSDYTHSNDYGAFRFAGYVFEELVAKQVIRTDKSLRQENEQANRVLTWNPPEHFPEIRPPENLADRKDPNAERLFENLERSDEFLTRVEALELVITAMHFFPTNVYNDAFDDIIGHEVYAGTVECALQNGLIPDAMIDNRMFHPAQLITGKEFYAVVANGYAGRKGKKPEIHRDELIEKDKITRHAGAEICKSLHI